MRESVLIANGQGFWGDSILGPIRLVQEGPLHYLALDYLAEVTMSIMQKLKSRDPSAGYATDFITYIIEHIQACGVSLADCRIQTDNGSEFIGSWNARADSAFTRAVLRVF